MSSSFILFIISLLTVSSEYTYFSDSRGVGIRNGEDVVCLFLSFGLQIKNYNLGEDSSLETIPLSEAVLGGRCGNKEDDSAYLSLKYTHINRTRMFRFNFKQATIMIDRYEQLRWSLFRIDYSESYAGQKVVFSSPNETSVISGPLKQQFTCRDSINTTLSSELYEPIDLFLNEPIEIQPYGLSSNIYLCERTRRRSLSQSLQTKSTVASGIVLLLSSIGVIVGHTLRRHFIPERKRAYDNLG